MSRRLPRSKDKLPVEDVGEVGCGSALGVSFADDMESIPGRLKGWRRPSWCGGF